MTVKFPPRPGQLRVREIKGRALTPLDLRWKELEARVMKVGSMESAGIEGLYRLVRRCQVSRGEKWALVELPKTPWAWHR